MKQTFPPASLLLLLHLRCGCRRTRRPTATGRVPRRQCAPASRDGRRRPRWDVGASRNVAWKTAIPGLAHSSPIVWGDRIYVTTAVAASGRSQVKTGDVEQIGHRFGHRHRAAHLAADRGRQARAGRSSWDRAVHQGVPRMKRHVKASHASATPATDGRSIVALLGSEGLFCFDMDGKQKWRADLGVMDVGLVDDPGVSVGPGQLAGDLRDRVIVQNDRHKDSFLAAYDLATGKEAVAHGARRIPVVGDAGRSCGSGGRTEVVTNAGQAHSRLRRRDRTRALAAVRTATPRSRCRRRSWPAIWSSSPAAIPPGGRPDLRDQAGRLGHAEPKSALAWQTERGSPYTGTPLVYDGILYVCTDNGILSAYDAATGERIYQQRVSTRRAGSARRRSPPAVASTWRARTATCSSCRRAGVRAARHQPDGRDRHGHAGDRRQHADRPHAVAARGHSAS